MTFIDIIQCRSFLEYININTKKYLLNYPESDEEHDCLPPSLWPWVSTEISFCCIGSPPIVACHLSTPVAAAELRQPCLGYSSPPLLSSCFGKGLCGRLDCCLLEPSRGLSPIPKYHMFPRVKHINNFPDTAAWIFLLWWICSQRRKYV